MEGYARLRSLSGGATIAPHVSRERRQPTKTRPIVLYFETPDLASRCRTLQRRGVRSDQLPARMTWGWDHVYLRDPEGHPISLHWAGQKRFRKSPPMSES